MIYHGDDETFPIVSLGDGTWVELSELPTVMWFTRAQIETMDDAPIDCEQAVDHVHIDGLLQFYDTPLQDSSIYE